MFFAIYVSTAKHPMLEDQLEALLAQSRAWNSQVGLTGMLLYKEGHFMQFLEGSKEEVLSLLDKIRQDPRHHNMIIIMQENHSTREFHEWAMGFQSLHHPGPLPDVPGYSELLDLPLSSEEFLLHPTKSLQLLLGFRRKLQLA